MRQESNIYKAQDEHDIRVKYYRNFKPKSFLCFLSNFKNTSN